MLQIPPSFQPPVSHAPTAVQHSASRERNVPATNERPPQNACCDSCTSQDKRPEPRTPAHNQDPLRSRFHSVAPQRRNLPPAGKHARAYEPSVRRKARTFPVAQRMAGHVQDNAMPPLHECSNGSPPRAVDRDVTPTPTPQPGATSLPPVIHPRSSTATVSDP